MASIDDLAALLLGASEKPDFGKNDPYAGFAGIGDSLSNAVVKGSQNYSTKENIIGGLLTGLLSGVGGGLSEDYQNRERQAYKDTILNSYLGRQTEQPQVLSDSLFNTAKDSAGVLRVKDTADKLDRIDTLATDATFKDPQNAEQIRQTAKAMKDEIAGIQRSAPASQVTEVEMGADLDNPLANGKTSTREKKKQYFEEYRKRMPAAQASKNAADDVAAEMKANAKSYDQAKEAREYGSKLINLANTARAGMSQAGETGPWNGVAGAYENVASLFGNPEAQSQLAGDATLKSIAPEIVQMFKSPGSVSDYETKLFLGAGPGTGQTPQTNAILVDKMEELGKVNLDYADFLEAYRSANAGDISGAQKKWREYTSVYPIFNRDADKIEINKERPGWQEYFANKAAGGEEAAPLQPREDAPSSSGISREQAIAELNRRRARTNAG